MQKRRRFTQQVSLEQRLSDDAQRLRDEAKLLPQSAERESALRKARQPVAGSRMSEWLRSGLRASV